METYSEKKYKYIITGALLFNIVPVLLVPILVLGNVSPFYVWPAEWLGISPNIDFHTFAVTVPFWGILGGITGYIKFRIRNKKTA